MIQACCDIRDELHEAEGLLLFGERLVVPASLRPDILQVIHGASRQRQMQSESQSEPVLASNGCGHREGSGQVCSGSDRRSHPYLIVFQH